MQLYVCLIFHAQFITFSCLGTPLLACFYFWVPLLAIPAWVLTNALQFTVHALQLMEWPTFFDTKCTILYHYNRALSLSLSLSLPLCVFVCCVCVVCACVCLCVSVCVCVCGLVRACVNYGSGMSARLVKCDRTIALCTTCAWSQSGRKRGAVAESDAMEQQLKRTRTGSSWVWPRETSACQRRYRTKATRGTPDSCRRGEGDETSEAYQYMSAVKRELSCAPLCERKLRWELLKPLHREESRRCPTAHV